MAKLGTVPGRGREFAKNLQARPTESQTNPANSIARRAIRIMSVALPIVAPVTMLALAVMTKKEGGNSGSSGSKGGGQLPDNQPAPQSGQGNKGHGGKGSK